MAQQSKPRAMDLVGLIVRITLAVVFIYHGYGKVFAGGHGHIAALMAEKGAPLPELLGWLAAVAEFGGGILIAVGLLARIWALGLVVVMAVAIGAVHGSHGFDIRNQGYEYCFVLLLMSLSILIAGPGWYSIDHFICGRCRRKAPAAAKE